MPQWLQAGLCPACAALQAKAECLPCTPERPGHLHAPGRCSLHRCFTCPGMRTSAVHMRLCCVLPAVLASPDMVRPLPDSAHHDTTCRASAVQGNVGYMSL